MSVVADNSKHYDVRGELLSAENLNSPACILSAIFSSACIDNADVESAAGVSIGNAAGRTAALTG